MDKKQQLLTLALCGLVGMAYAGEKEELLKLRNTTTNLIKELVKQGILTQQAAEEMIKRAEADAEAQAQQQATAPGHDEPLEPGEVRVPYVPEFVKDEIREQVRKELKADVVKDVVQEAKSKKWGVPDALPEWISRFKLSGDLRLRSQNEFMGSDNITNSGSEAFYRNYQAINTAGGQTAAGNNAFINTKQDRHRLRERLRLAIDAKITEGLNAGVRLATSNIPDPVSTNQTLGNTGSQYAFNVDRAFLRYDAVDAQGFKWLTLAGGRVANPWYVGGGEFTGGSELVWDTDLSFEGLVGTIRHRLTSSHPTHPEEDNRHSAFFTLGAFPLQESQLTANDKWLFGSQLGVDWGFDNHDVFKMALAYFDYENIEAVSNKDANPICSTNTALNDLSVPQFVQFGNTMAIVCNENSSSTSGALPGLYGLASDFNIINFALAYDLAKFAPYHLIVSGDFAKNIGYDINRVRERTNALAGTSVKDLNDETNAWQVRMDFGWPKVEYTGQWNVFALYKYVERDSVFDAFSDSDFHLGGTNAKGWVVGGNYGLMKNVWATGRWLSTDVISGPKYSNDILQLDVNTRF